MEIYTFIKRAANNSQIQRAIDAFSRMAKSGVRNFNKRTSHLNSLESLKELDYALKNYLKGKPLSRNSLHNTARAAEYYKYFSTLDRATLNGLAKNIEILKAKNIASPIADAAKPIDAAATAAKPVNTAASSPFISPEAAAKVHGAVDSTVDGINNAANATRNAIDDVTDTVVEKGRSWWPYAASGAGGFVAGTAIPAMSNDYKEPIINNYIGQ